jgi:cyclopropane fatty-acyl-phospholipid synthase-like methyltransferase
MNLKGTYNKIAVDWFKDHKNDDWWVEGTNFFISLLKKGGRVLDVGCGAGVKSKYLLSKSLEVIGIDFSEKFIEIAAKEVPEAKFLLLDMKDINMLGIKFDGIFAQASLLHIAKKDVVDVLFKFVESLAPDGCLYIAVKGLREGGKEEETIEENDYGYKYERFFSFYTMDELKKYLSDLGLNVVYENSKIVGRTNWLQIVAKKL